MEVHTKPLSAVSCTNPVNGRLYSHLTHSCDYISECTSCTHKELWIARQRGHRQASQRYAIWKEQWNPRRKKKSVGIPNDVEPWKKTCSQKTGSKNYPFSKPSMQQSLWCKILRIAVQNEKIKNKETQVYPNQDKNHIGKTLFSNAWRTSLTHSWSDA